MCELQGVRTLVPEEGGGLYRVRQDPSSPPLHRVQYALRRGVTGNAYIKVPQMTIKYANEFLTVTAQSGFRSSDMSSGLVVE